MRLGKLNLPLIVLERSRSILLAGERYLTSQSAKGDGAIVMNGPVEDPSSGAEADPRVMFIIVRRDLVRYTRTYPTPSPEAGDYSAPLLSAT